MATVKIDIEETGPVMHINLPLPDGTILQTSIIPDCAYPAAEIRWVHDGVTDRITAVEYNIERQEDEKLCIETYAPGTEDPIRYEPYGKIEGTI